MTPLLSAADVSYWVGARPLVSRISLDLGPGDVLGVVGPNGAGKSTLLKVMAGDLRPSSGEVRLRGRALDAWTPAELALRRAVLPQETILQFAFSVRQVVEMGRAPHRASPTEHARAIDRALAEADAAVLAPRSSRGFPAASGRGSTLPGSWPRRRRSCSWTSRRLPSISAIKRWSWAPRSASRAGARPSSASCTISTSPRPGARVAILHHGELVACGAPDEVLTAERLSAVFEHPIAVWQKAAAGRRLVVPAAASVLADGNGHHAVAASASPLS